MARPCSTGLVVVGGPLYGHRGTTLTSLTSLTSLRFCVSGSDERDFRITIRILDIGRVRAPSTQ